MPGALPSPRSIEKKAVSRWTKLSPSRDRMVIQGLRGRWKKNGPASRMTGDFRAWCMAVILSTYHWGNSEKAATRLAGELVDERKAKLQAGATGAAAGHLILANGSIPDCFDIGAAEWDKRLNQMIERLDRAAAGNGEIHDSEPTRPAELELLDAQATSDPAPRDTTQTPLPATDAAGGVPFERPARTAAKAILGQVLDTLNKPQPKREPMNPLEMSASTLGAINEIETARRYPRNLAQSIERATRNACATAEIAAACTFHKPIGGGTVDGPSVRLVEIVAAAYGNLQSASFTVEIGAKTVTARGMCWDLEWNNRISCDTVRSIMTKDGRRYSDSQVAVTCQAAEAIAWRNAVIKCIGRSVFNEILAKTQEAARGPAGQTRITAEAVVGRFLSSYGIPEFHVCNAVGKSVSSQLTDDDIGKLRGLGNSIREGDIDLADAFPKFDGVEAAA